MARIHRDGQTRPCVIYRLLTTGTMDEKIYQRQLRKGELAEAMGGGGGGGSVAIQGKQQRQQTPKFTLQELQQIFTIDTETSCETAEILRSAAESSASVEVGGGRGDDGGCCWANEMGSLDDAALLAAIDSTRAVTFVRMDRGRQQPDPPDCHEGATATAKDTTQEGSISGISSGRMSIPAKDRGRRAPKRRRP